MEKSEQINEIALALSNFQGAIGNVHKTENNSFFKSKYADLATIRSFIKQELHNNGLAVSQLLEGDCELTTILTHTSGQYFKSTSKLYPVKIDPQGIMSATTYQRRNALMAILGLAAEDEDDDGNSANLRGSNNVLEACLSLIRASNEDELKAVWTKHKDFHQNALFSQLIEFLANFRGSNSVLEACLSLISASNEDELKAVWTKHKNIQQNALFSKLKDISKTNLSK